MTLVSIILMVLCIGCIWGGLGYHLLHLLKAQKETRDT